tara:strand:+ start:1048 stop:1767 length:720 start_codon:yes stop_codon:yes gene_type:complete
MPKKQKNLPNELIFLPNADKQSHEKWKDGRNLLNFPKPYRMLLFGSPGSGKTNFIHNVIMRADPPFEKIYVFHPDPESREYAMLGNHVEMLDSMPSKLFCDPKLKNLLILDDIEYKNLNKEDKASFDRLSGYTSTHRNCSLMITSQDAINVPASVRRNTNIFILYKNVPDLNSLAQIASKVGLNADKLFSIFDNCMQGQRDNLTIDLTQGSPAKFRVNGFRKIKEVSASNKKERLTKYE